MKALLIALSLMGSVAFADSAPVDVCKTYFVCGTYSGEGDYRPDLTKPGVDKATYTITAVSAGQNLIDLNVKATSKPYPMDMNVRFQFKDDGTIALMAGKVQVGGGICRAQSCSFVIGTDELDPKNPNLATLRFFDGKMEFIFMNTGNLAAQMQATLPKTK